MVSTDAIRQQLFLPFEDQSSSFLFSLLWHHPSKGDRLVILVTAYQRWRYRLIDHMSGIRVTVFSVVFGRSGVVAVLKFSVLLGQSFPGLWLGELTFVGDFLGLHLLGSPGCWFFHLSVCNIWDNQPTWGTHYYVISYHPRSLAGLSLYFLDSFYMHFLYKVSVFSST